MKNSSRIIWNISFLLIVLAWLFIWVMLPTKLYKNTWTPKLTKKLSYSTYFKEQEMNLLLFSFPVMLLAALGCVYLHLCKKSNADDTVGVGGFQSWKRPMLVVAPLGIVNAVELTFILMFVALLTWSLANYLYISFGALHIHKVGEKIWQAKFRSVSLRLGYIGHICWALLFFPVSRGSSILPLFGLTSESSIKYHIWLGHTSNLLFALHSIGFFIYWSITNQMVEALEWSSTYVSNIAGEIAFVVSILMWIPTLYSIRRKLFEVFFYSHYLYIVYVIFYVLHVGPAYFCMILPNIFLFVIDRTLRFLQSRQRTRVVSARVLPSGTVELNFAKNRGLLYNPTSILFVNVPSISKLQWHPYSVISSSAMEQDMISVAIKVQGSWSQKLCNQLSSSPSHLQVSTEGPYGPASSHFLRRETVVMISGGSGITTFISILRELFAKISSHDNNKDGQKYPKQVILISAFKNSADLTMLDLLLPLSNTSSINLSKMQLQIEAYITREKESPIDNKRIQTIWFKPKSSDVPLSGVLGPQSWLWLGAIISSSFIMFLLLLGIVTRYSIYPVENDGKTYHYSMKLFWDMFLVCACVFVAASAIFMVQKRENNAMESKQIQNTELQTPTSSPKTWFNGAEREVESVPHHSIVQATNVHFGARPDLKKILFDCKGSDVGVLACGPREMRHEVAKICGSGQAKNLHFESISFNW